MTYCLGMLLDAGLIDEERARTHPDRNIITRALGAAEEVEPEAWLFPATQPQTFLICSDGLTKEVDDERIAAVLASSSEPASAVELLLDAALGAGGHDNVTIVLVTSDYRSISRGRVGAGVGDAIDEQTRDRVLSPELEDTLPRV